jgi:hypothetical protein
LWRIHLSVVRSIGEAEMAGRERNPVEADNPIRELLGRATEETSLRRILSDAGIDMGAGYMAVHRWFEGRKSSKGDRYYPPLQGEVREKLMRFLESLYSEELEALYNIRNASTRARLAKLVKLVGGGTWAPSAGSREWFAEILKDRGCDELSWSQIRAGHFVYVPSYGGFSEEDYEEFAELLGEDDRLELMRIVEYNKERRKKTGN